jgi:hypothetical protein
MTPQNIKEEQIILPDHIKGLSMDDINQFRQYFGLCEQDSLSVQECRDLLDQKLGKQNLSEIIIAQRRKASF